MVKVSAGEPNHGEGDSSTGRSPADDLQGSDGVSVCGEVRRDPVGQRSVGRAAVNSFPTAPGGDETAPVGDPAELYSTGGGGAAGPVETPTAGPPVGSLRDRGEYAADAPAGGEGVGATRGAPTPDLPTTTISPWKAARQWYDHDPMRLAAQMPPEFRVHMLDPMAEHDVAIAAWLKGGRS
jgi:hypothetical protein